MDEFLKLKWGIKEPQELDYGPDFIPHDEISRSYIYSDMETNLLTDSQNKIDKQKIISEKPVVPGYKYIFKTNIKSFLNIYEQAQCLVALKLLQAGKTSTGVYEQQCVELYNNSLQDIVKENTNFLEFANQGFLKNKNKTFKLSPLLKNYAISLWKDKLKRSKDYPELYKGIDILPYSYKEDEESVEMTHLQNILSLGTLAKYTGPTLLKSYHLKKGYLPRKKEIYNSNQPVSKDKNIDKLIEMNQVNIVISSSGLKKLMNFTKNNSSWDIPVTVKECIVKNKNGTDSTKTIAFVDKPLPNKSPSLFEFNEQCFKILLKTNFCDTEAFSFPDTEVPVDTCYVGTDKKDEHLQMAADNSTKRKLVEEDDTAKTNKKIKLEENGVKFHHNVSYRIWNLQLKNEQCELIKSKSHINNIQVLIRTKLDACEECSETGGLKPIIVIPKLEYHLEYGANLPTKNELVSEWVSTYFRPCSQLRRIRTHYSTGEIISIETCTTQKIAFEAQTNFQTNVHLGFGVLYKIFSKLIDLLPGNYMLYHLPKDGMFVQLLQATTENDDGIYNLHKEYEEKNCNVNTTVTKTWHPIDANFILPKHNAMQRMPGMFPPSLPKPKFFKFTKKKKNNNKKKKKKKNNIKKMITKNNSVVNK